MAALSNFEKTVNKHIWKQQPTTTLNEVCREINCYSTCHFNCKSNFSTDLKWFLGHWIKDKKCPKCNHRLSNHYRQCVKWAQVPDIQVLVDEDMQKKWEMAKDEKEKVAALLEQGKKALQGLNKIISDATNNLSRLTEEFANLSLSGSFSTQVEKAVGLLEQTYKSMEEKCVNPTQLQKVKDNLDQMTRKLELLNKVKERSEVRVAA